MHLRTFMIPAAGLGRRLLRATKRAPKGFFNDCHRPVLQFALDGAINAGAKRIILGSHPDKLAIRDFLQPDQDDINRLAACGNTLPGAAMAAVQVPETVDPVFAFQNRSSGPGHAVSGCSAMVLPGPVGVIRPDDGTGGDACLPQMARAHAGGHMVAAMTVPDQDAPRYGIFRLLGAPLGRSVALSGMVETPKAGTEPSLLAAARRYTPDPAAFSTVFGVACGAGGGIPLPDAIAVYAARMTPTAVRFPDQRLDRGSQRGVIGAGRSRHRRVRRQPDGAESGVGAARRQARVNDSPPATRRLDGRAIALEGSAA